MGQQQILLIVLGVIIVGIAVAISIQLFNGNAINNKRDLLMNECQTIGTIALSYYKKPSEFGGGGNEFTGWAIPDAMKFTENGSYIVQVSQDSVIITGTGTEVITGTDSIKVQTTITPNAMNSIVIN